MARFMKSQWIAAPVLIVVLLAVWLFRRDRGAVRRIPPPDGPSKELLPVADFRGKLGNEVAFAARLCIGYPYTSVETAESRVLMPECETSATNGAMVKVPGVLSNSVSTDVVGGGYFLEGKAYLLLKPTVEATGLVASSANAAADW